MLKYFKEAKTDFLKVIKHDKNNIPAHFYLATSHLFLGEFSNAITAFTVCTNYDSLDFDAHLGLAIAYLKTENLEKSKYHFQKVKNILQLKNPETIELFKDTYWYKNLYFYFNAAFDKLNRL